MVIRRKFQQTNGGNLVEMISQGEYNKGVMQGRFKTSFATLLVFTFILGVASALRLPTGQSTISQTVAESV